MAGRINDEDIALVRERARIDEIVGEYVQLRNAGGGSLKGLCPFHDERTPSFQVTPSRGLFYCFGCGEGGDVISFVEKIDNLTFVEAVQRLADKVGVQLRIVDDGRPGIEPGLRLQILEANDAAAEFYHQQVSSSEGIIARQFLDGRGFEREAAETFHIGYAPRGGHVLRDHLLAKGFSPKALVSSGLVREKGWDFFQGRVLWPIKDSGKSVLGFGARRVYDDDRLPAKYINTPETVVYKKSHVLYGLDLSRTNIGRKRQAVVMEGYTDVMAAHLSGVDTAVASCGTAFGSDHARLLQRLMGNNGALSGEVVFTFDGDAAGRKAALKVYQGDSEFVSQTYVAVEPNGLDPCDLRIQHGPEAVRELVARRIPLYRYVMDNVVHDFDLDRADGRVAAVRAAAPLVTSIRDSSLVDGYLRELSQIVGMDVDEVRREVARTRRNPAPPADLRPTLRVLPEVADPAPQAPA
ncbi:DNA primase, partial [Acidipropionibacterium jensenii]